MRTRWAGSADKHGIEHADAAHAMRHPKIKLFPFDASRIEGQPQVWLFIGPTHDGSAYLEVFAHQDETGDAVVFHVMPLRRSTLERARKAWENQQKERE